MDIWVNTLPGSLDILIMEIVIQMLELIKNLKQGKLYLLFLITKIKTKFYF